MSAKPPTIEDLKVTRLDRPPSSQYGAVESPEDLAAPTARNEFCEIKAAPAGAPLAPRRPQPRNPPGIDPLRAMALASVGIESMLGFRDLAALGFGSRWRIRKAWQRGAFPVPDLIAASGVKWRASTIAAHQAELFDAERARREKRR